MHFKMIVVFVEDEKTDDVMDAARSAGATGATVIMIFLFIDILQ